MTDSQKKMLKKLGIKEASLKPKVKPSEEHISREDFGLLDMQDENTIYYIYEDDGNVTVKKGETL